MENLLSYSTRNQVSLRPPRSELPDLRIFPSCSVAQVALAGAGTDTATIPRGTELTASGADGTCRFRTASAVALAPVDIVEARFDATVDGGGARRLPLGVTSTLSITLRSTRAGAGLAQVGTGWLRVFIDGDPALCAALLDCLFLHAECAYADVPGAARCWMLESLPIAAAGLDADELLVAPVSGETSGACLLTEYFAFPEKFNFFDIDLAALAAHVPHKASSVTVHFALAGISAKPAMVQALAELSADHLLLGCTPVLNLTPAYSWAGRPDKESKEGGDPLRLLREPTPPRWHRPGSDRFSEFSRTLARYGWPQTLACRHEIGGVVGIETRRASGWTHNQQGASLPRGTEIRVLVDEAAIAESSLYLFAQVLCRFFDVNRLLLVDHQSGKELVHCVPGDTYWSDAY